MTHYDERRENDMCGIEDQIAEYCNRDNDAEECPDCGEILDFITDGYRSAMYCPYCEVEVEFPERDEPEWMAYDE